MTTRPIPGSESQPMRGPCEMYTFIAMRAMMKLMSPPQSKRPCLPLPAAFDSGVPRSRNRATIESAIEIQKMERQPRTDVAINPPKRAVKPEPPQEPIDQNERPLTSGAIVVGLHERHRRRHDARRREALHDASAEQRTVGEHAGVRRGERDEQRAEDAQVDADVHDLHSAHAVGEAAGDDDEDAGEQDVIETARLPIVRSTPSES